MSRRNALNDHHPYSYRADRADVEPLQDALSSPSPLGNILDDFHRNHSKDGVEGRQSSYPLSPMSQGIPNDGTSNATKSEYSIFGGGSIGSSVVASTIVSGVHHTIAHWKVLLLGQLLAFFLAAAGATSEELNDKCNVSIPLTQTSLVGLVLMLFGACRMRGWCAGCCSSGGGKKNDGDLVEEEESFYNGSDHDECEHRSMIRPSLNDEDDGDDLSFEKHPIAKLRMTTSPPRSFCCGLQTIHAPWWAYFFAGLVAVEAHYFVFLAFRYTSFSFIYLVEALAIPSAMAFTKCLLKRKYTVTHVLGGLLAIIGIAVSTVSDLNSKEIENIGSRSDIDPIEHLRGDMLAISGAVLMGLDDVISEMLMKTYAAEENELLFFKWFFGASISVFQLIVLERDSLISLLENRGGGGDQCNDSMIFLLLGIFVVFLSLELVGEMRFLNLSEAALLNLSLLTSNVWATVFSLFAEGVVPSGGYYAALVLIVSGIVLYEAGPSPTCPATPSDIKIRTHHVQSDVAEVAANRQRDEKIEGHLEMT